jgi:hypothetical protein
VLDDEDKFYYLEMTITKAHKSDSFHLAIAGNSEDTMPDIDEVISVGLKRLSKELGLKIANLGVGLIVPGP